MCVWCLTEYLDGQSDENITRTDKTQVIEIPGAAGQSRTETVPSTTDLSIRRGGQAQFVQAIAKGAHGDSQKSGRPLF